MIQKLYFIFVTIIFITLFNPANGQVKVGDKLIADWIEYDFGQLQSGAFLDCNLCLTNYSGKTVIIESIIPGCRCVQVPFKKPIKLKKGKKATIRIHFDSAGLRPGYIEQDLILSIRDYPNPYIFKIKGTLAKKEN